MTTFASRIQKAHSLFVHSANSLQSAFLLSVRLYWGWQFAVDGWSQITFTRTPRSFELMNAGRSTQRA
jgi:putative oxidoreductase